MRKSWRYGIFGGLAALGIVAAAFLFITWSIKSQAADTLKAQEEYYEQLEREYITRVRGFLAEQGYRNSGVTLSRVVDGEGQRSYMIRVHHSAMEQLNDEKLAELLEQIECMGFYVPGCSFTAQQLR